MFEKTRKMDGYQGIIEPGKMKSRHDELALEMARRGYNHKSPYELPENIEEYHHIKVDKARSLELFSRCKDCRRLYEIKRSD
jgi:hypothetical protein